MPDWAVAFRFDILPRIAVHRDLPLKASFVMKSRPCRVAYGRVGRRTTRVHEAPAEHAPQLRRKVST